MFVNVTNLPTQEENIVQDFVNEILSPLVLLIFVIAILAALADARPETVIKMVLDAVVSIFEIIFKSTAKIIELIFKIIEIIVSGKKRPSPKSPYPRKDPPPKRGPGRPRRNPRPEPEPEIKLVEVEVLPPK